MLGGLSDQALSPPRLPEHDMSQAKTLTTAEYRQRVGSELGVSDWIVVAQDTINRFADATGDHQFIHVDLERARLTPFGGTVAHGFLTLSLLPKLAEDALPAVSGQRMGVNYGFEKVRFITPVKSGARIRGRFALTSLDEQSPGQWRLRIAATVEIEGEAKPALVADWLSLSFV
jgi:acyl dehydratase